MAEDGPQVGTILDARYRISRHVADGALGKRYVARDQETRKQVAVTVVHPELMEIHGDAFMQTSELAASLESEHTVHVLSFGMHGEYGYRVTTWERGTLLSTALEGDRVLMSSAVSWTADIARALDEAHAKGLVHKGIGPEAIRLHKRSEPPDAALLDDWGLATLLEGSDPTSSTGLLFVGGAAWLAPEYVQGKDYDPRSDLYSLGCVLFQLVTGRPPFIGPSMKVLASHVNEPAPPPSQHASGVPHWLDELVLELMAKNPDDRPQRAALVADRLDEGAALLVDGAAHPERVTANAAPTRLPRVQIRGAGAARTPSIVERPAANVPGRAPLPAWFFVFLATVGFATFTLSFLLCMNR